MIAIYCIKDINDMKYVGSTEQTLKRRLLGHRCNKRAGQNCSSSKLDLEHSVIYELERCQDNERTERERYWINKIDCVNTMKLNYDKKEDAKKYYQVNKDKMMEKQRDRRQRIRISKFIKMLDDY
tara:strand:+ start:954 stop:1328 length:375 start_codon:yes stop_codon:yes gene_type:complete